MGIRFSVLIALLAIVAGLSSTAAASVSWGASVYAGTGSYNYYNYGYCGDGICSGGENYWNCPSDCGSGYYSMYSYYGDYYYLYYPYSYYYYSYPYYYTSSQPVSSGASSTCSDGTRRGECATVDGEPSGLLCSDNGITKAASICGCPSGYVASGDNCVNTCSDGTPLGQCSANLPYGCGTDGVLKSYSGACGCPTGFVEDSRSRTGCTAVSPTCSIDMANNNYQIRATESVSVAVNYFNYPGQLQTVQVACGDGQVIQAQCGQAQNAGTTLSPVYQGTCTATCTYGPEANYPSKHTIKAYAAGSVCGGSTIQVIPPAPTRGSILVQATDCETGAAVSGARVNIDSIPVPSPTPVPVVTQQTVEIRPGPGGRDTFISVRTETTRTVSTMQPAAGSGQDTYIDSANASNNAAAAGLVVGYDAYNATISLVGHIMNVNDAEVTSDGTRVQLISITPVGFGPGSLPLASFNVTNSSGAQLTILTMDASSAPVTMYGFTLAVNVVFAGINGVNYADVNFTYQQPTTSTKRALFSFSVSGVPAGATVESAVLRLYANSTNAAAMNVSVHQATSNWTSAATWAMRSPTTTWANAGGDYAATPENTVSVSGEGWYSVNVTSLARAWVAGTANNGIVIRAVNESVLANKTIYSSEAPAAYAPQLIVTYSTIAVRDTDNNYGNSQALRAGFDATTNTTYRSLAYFDVSSIPANAVINSAQLVLSGDGTGAAAQVSVHDASRAWTEGTGAVNSGATWVSANGTGNWSNPGADYNGIAEGTQNVSTSGDYSWDVTNLVRADVAGGSAANNGILIRAVDEAQNVTKQFYSGEANATFQPRLRVNYTITTMIPVNYTAPAAYSAVSYTDSNGQVVFDLMNPMLHTIAVSKAGYPSASSSATPTVGNIAPVGVCLSRAKCDVSAELVGSTKDLIQIKVTNNGGVSGTNSTFTLNYTSAFPLEGPTAVYVGPNEQQIVNLVPKPPATYVGGTKAIVTVAGNGTCRANIEVPIVINGGIILQPVDAEKEAFAGTKTCFKIVARNTGADKGTVTLTASGDYPNTISPKQFILSPRETKYVDLCVNAPAGAQGSKSFTVNALSAINDAAASVTLKLPEGLAFASDFSGCPAIEASDTPVYQAVSLQNQVGEGDYVASIAGATDGIRLVQPLIYNFARDETRPVYLVFDTSKMAGGDHQMELLLKKDGRVAYRQELCFSYGSRQEAEIEVLPASITVPRGASQSAFAIIRNSGNVRATYSLNTSGQFSTVTMTPSTVTIEPGEEAQVEVHVDPAQYTSAGSYAIPINAVAGGKIAATQSLMVRVVTELLFHTAVSNMAVSFGDADGKPQAKIQFVATNNEPNPVTVNANITGLPGDWIVTVEPANALLSPGESKQFTATIVAETAEAKDYPATIELSTSDGKKSFIPVNVPMGTYYSGISGLFAFASSEAAIGVFIVLLAAIGLYMYTTGKQNAREAEKAAGKAGETPESKAAKVAQAVRIAEAVKSPLPPAPKKQLPAKKKK